MNLLRWILALPAGLAGAFLTHMVSSFAFGLVHGFEKVAEFWAATDMAGMWLTGTYILVVTRVATGAAFTWMTARVAPTRNLEVARVSLALLAGLLIVMLVFGVLPTASLFSSSRWYRMAVETVALLGGAWLAGNQFRRPKTKTPLPEVKTETPADLSRPMATRNQIIRAYGTVLEQSAYQRRFYMCELDLPFPKAVISRALESALAESVDNKLREHLEVGFIELEAFLPLQEYEQVKGINMLSQLSTVPSIETQFQNLMEKYRSGGPVDPADKEIVLKIADQLGLSKAEADNINSISTAVAAKQRERLQKI